MIPRRARPGIGQLRERVDLLQLVTTTDAQGGFTEDWTTVAGTTWALVNDISSAERMRGQQQEGRRTYDVYLRWNGAVAINSGWRLKWKRTGSVLRIIGIEYLDPTHRFLKVTCEELAAQGAA